MSSCRSCCQCQSCWWWRGWCFACLTLTMWMTITSRRGLCLSRSLACLFPFALSASTSSLFPLLPLPLQPYFSHSCTCLYLLVLGLAGRPRLPFVCCFIFIIFGNPASHILCLHSHTHAHTRAYIHVSKNRLRFIVLLNLVDFCWRLIFCGFSFSFPVLFSFLAFEFTANLLQIVCKVGSPFAPRCYSKLKSSAKKIWNSFALSAQLELVGHWPKWLRPKKVRKKPKKAESSILSIAVGSSWLSLKSLIKFLL